LAIALTVFGFSLFGDSLRDALDPKLARPLTRTLLAEFPAFPVEPGISSIGPIRP